MSDRIITLEESKNSTNSQENFAKKFNSNEQNHIKILEILHLSGNFFSGGILSSLFIVVFLAIQSDISPKVRAEAYNIINFNISFLLWFILSGILCLLIIGFFMLIFFFIAWCILMIIGAIKHFAGDTYDYPITIKFLK